MKRKRKKKAEEEVEEREEEENYNDEHLVSVLSSLTFSSDNASA